MTAERFDFLCNVCGRRNHGVPLDHVQNREFQSCGSCHASLRMRSLMYALSQELFGSPRALPAFPEDKSIRGIGMSDWEGYAGRLAEKLDYVNTFYHCEPRLDIAEVPEERFGRYDFLISSDVFEHIPPDALERAFANSRKLLRPGGSFILTVPFNKEGETREHFPRLHDFRIVEEGGRRVLRNRTVEGEEEAFDQLVFHGGEGMTLEMRMFAEADLLRRLHDAGFSSAAVRADHAPRFGIMWPIDHSLPIVARA
ncbi:MAG TPA: class I SAM-dependent methyltransferase [Usitatibacter sp.]|nr:class I SAM-dependent methyltransferase [Usitatibacter sp.]